jgi:hypothetical protein
LPPRLVGSARFRVRRIGARQLRAGRDAALDEFLHLLLRGGIEGHFVGERRRDRHHAVGVAHDHVAGKDGNAAAADADAEFGRVMRDQAQRRRRAGAEDRKAERLYRRGIAHAAVRDEARRTAHRKPGDQDVARGGGARIAAAIDHQYVARRDDFDRLALRMLGIRVRLDRVEVLARRDIAEREGRAEKVAPGWAERADALHEEVAEAALEELRGQGGGARLAERTRCFWLEHRGRAPPLPGIEAVLPLLAPSSRNGEGGCRAARRLPPLRSERTKISRSRVCRERSFMGARETTGARKRCGEAARGASDSHAPLCKDCKTD